MVRFVIFLYHKPLAPVGFYGGTDGLASLVIWRAFFRFFIVTPRKFTFSLEYVENDERLIAAKDSDAYNIVSPV